MLKVIKEIMSFNSNNSVSVTNAPISYIRWQHWNWIVPEIVNSIFILMTIWILFLLIYYGNKSKKWVNKKTKNFEKLNAGYILMAAVLCAVMALLRFIVSQLVFNIEFSESENNLCKRVSNASIIIFCLNFFAVYIYLWIRQIIFYENNMLNTDFSKSLRFFSYLSIILIFFGGLGAIFVNTIPTNYVSTLKGCVYVPLDPTFSAILVIVSSFVLLSGQIVLVALLIYPLHKHSKQKGCLTLCGITKCSSKMDNQQNACKKYQNDFLTVHCRTNRKINMILRRTVCFSIIIVVSNLVLLLVSTYGFRESDDRNISTMLYDIITFANLAFVMTSIGGWKNIVRLTPPTYSVIVIQSTPRSPRAIDLKRNSVIN